VAEAAAAKAADARPSGPLEARGSAPNGELAPKVQVKGDWGSDPVHNVGVRSGLYDAETGTLHVGGMEGHRGVARGAGIGDKPGTNISGLEIVQRGDGISFRDRSGWYPRVLTPEEQASIAKALEAEFGKPAKYDPNLGTVLRPGAPKNPKQNEPEPPVSWEAASFCF
jgi:hypothetical protein